MTVLHRHTAESHLFGLGKSIMIYCNLICNSFSRSIHYHLAQAWVTAIQPLQNPWKHQGAPRFYMTRGWINFFHHLILFPLRKDSVELLLVLIGTINNFFLHLGLDYPRYFITWTQTSICMDWQLDWWAVFVKLW